MLSAALLVAAPLHAQVIESREGPLTPYHKASDGTVSSPHKDPAPFTAVYASIFPGQSATINDVAGSVQAGNPLLGVVFPSLQFSVSVASRLLTEQNSSRRSEEKFISAVRRLNVHVQVTALDAKRQPIVTASGKSSPAIVLTVAPAASAYSAATGSAGSELKNGLDVVMKHLGPIGAIAQTFEGAYKLTPSPTQVAYQNSDREFGWTWYQSPDSPIEGLHRTAVLMQTSKEVVYLQIHLDIVTDWIDFGAWTKSFDFLTVVASAAPSTSGLPSPTNPDTRRRR